MSDQRPAIISCDGHATGRPEDYVPYIEPRYRDQYDEFVRVLEAARVARAEATQEGRSLFSKEGVDGFTAATGNARDGEWNSRLRTDVLDGEGVVAEVLFPNNGVPFGGFGESAQHELRGAGNRAYDRWLLDFANDTPGRRAALAMLTVHDLDATVAEIVWARDNGMKGVIIPTVPGEGLPPYYDECYDRMWAACQDCELPVHIHGGSGTPSYGDYGAVSMLVYATETVYFAHRPLWFLIWGGVLERFGRMKLVFTESRCDWVPSTLVYLDAIYSQPYFSHIRQTVKLKPSEYWERQCYVAASFMGPDESAIRHEVGLSKLMWGADYPHLEGTWPRTRKSLARCFRGIPAGEVRAILTDNPARLYGFDVDALQPIADRVCPTLEELTGVA
jgi:Predicted metal-dependent hydrolase of the TIM-barrel fold